MNPITHLIKTYYNSINWKYEIEEDEDHDEIIFSTDSSILWLILVKKDFYHIQCRSKLPLPKDKINTAIDVINQYNLKSYKVWRAISEKGMLWFYLTGPTYTEEFSIEQFINDCKLISDVMASETVDILLKLQDHKNFSLFSFFKKKMTGK